MSTYRRRKVQESVYCLSREEIIQLLLSDGQLIKRPFLIYKEEKVILGFNEIEYAKQII